MAAWIEQGPRPTIFGQDEGIIGNGTTANPDNPVVGAVEAIAVEPGSSDVVYAGTVNGGVWKTTNATAANPTWTPLTDDQVSLSTGDLAFAPTDSTFQTLYVGTGSFSSFGNAGGPGRGLLETTDGGASWTNLNPGGIFNNRFIKSVVPTTLGGGDVLLVGTFYDGGGVYRSADGGASFTRISGSAGLPSAGVSHLVPDPFVSTRFYAGVPNFGVYRSDDGGLTWTQKNTGLVNPNLANDRVELAPSPAGSGVIFATLIRQGRPTGFFRSTNSGDSWTQMDLAGTNEGGGFEGTNPGEDEEDEFPGAQGFLHFALLADRTDPFVVFASGDRQPNPFPNSIGAQNFSGRVFRGNASAAAGTQWVAVTNNGADPDGTGPLAGTSPHADSRDMVFDANGNILQGNDGGIYRLVNPNNNAANSGRQWVSAIGNLRDTEFHSVAYSTLTDTIIGGAQDTGTPVQASTDTSIPWQEFLQGDGGKVQIDDVSTPGTSIRYTSTQFFGFFNRTTWNSSNQRFGPVQQVALRVTNQSNQFLLNIDPNIQFYQPYELNAIDPRRMLIGTASIYESSNQGDSLTNLGFTGGFITSLVYGGRYRGVDNPGLYYVSTTNGAAKILYRSGDGQGQQNLTSYPGLTVRDMVVDPQNSRRLFVLDIASRVWQTVNAGKTWVNITSNVNSLAPGGTPNLQTISFIGNSQDYDTAVLAVGGYGGVYSIRSPGLAGVPLTWRKLGTGLSNAVVSDLRYDVVDDVLVAGTIGRGAWKITDPAGDDLAPAGLRGLRNATPDAGRPNISLPDFDAPIVPPIPFRGRSASPIAPSRGGLGASRGALSTGYPEWTIAFVPDSDSNLGDPLATTLVAGTAKRKLGLLDQ